MTPKSRTRNAIRQQATIFNFNNKRASSSNENRIRSNSQSQLGRGTEGNVVTSVFESASPKPTECISISSTNSEMHFKILPRKILAPDGAAYDRFGRAVFTTEDIIAIGSPFDTDNGIASGSVYIFSFSGDFITKLIAPDGKAGDQFGDSICISGDSIAVGAPHHKIRKRKSRSIFKEKKRGSVYIFSTGGQFITKLTAPDGTDRDHFGHSIHISGNIVAVGSPRDHIKANDTGCVYVFLTNGEFLTKITAPDSSINDRFGWCVSTAGSLIAVGAPWDNEKGYCSGSVHVFVCSSSGDLQFITKLTAPDGVTGDQFGLSISTSDSIIAVGSRCQSGSVKIFSTAGEYITKLKAPHGIDADCDRFVYSISITNEVIAVGSPWSYDNSNRCGSVYIFSIDGEFEFKFITKLTVRNEYPDNEFGYGICASGSFIVVGTPGDNDDCFLKGSAYIFSIQDVIQKYPSS